MYDDGAQVKIENGKGQFISSDGTISDLTFDSATKSWRKPNDTEFEFKLGKSAKINTDDIFMLSLKDDPQALKNYSRIKNECNDSELAWDYRNSSNEEIETVIKYSKEYGFNHNLINYIKSNKFEINADNIEQIKILNDANVACGDIQEIVKYGITKEDCIKITDVLKGGEVPVYRIIECLEANWDDAQWSAYSELCRFASDDLTLYDSFECLSKVDSKWSAEEIAKYTQESKKGTSYHDAAILSKNLWDEASCEKYSQKIEQMTKNNQYEQSFAKILDLDNMSLEVKEQILKSGLSVDEFISSIDKLTKTYKQAIKNPSQYLNTNNSDSANLDVTKIVNNFFSSHIGELARASKYLDTDTLNQMMAKHLNNFGESIRNINQLTDSNYQLLSDLSKCSSTDGNGKALSAKEKIELTQIISLYQECRADTSKLRTMLESGEASVKGAKTALQDEVLKKAGLAEEQIANIPKESRFNDEYIYLALNPKYDPLSVGGLKTKDIYNTDALYTVIKEAASGNFKKYISDESNVFGKANAKTKEAFSKNGLNYENWLDPKIPETKVQIGDQELTIKLWNRNPQEDLFLGNKTDCCTHIQCNNGAATPVYLANTAFNVVEIYDASGNVVGMSRVFMANVDEKQTLCIDSFELNNSFKSSLESSSKIQLRDALFGYMGKYATEVAGADSQVVFTSYDGHISTEDLKYRSSTKTEFIGSISQDSIYINACDAGWENIEAPLRVNWEQVR